MEIKTQITNSQGKVFEVIYRDEDPETNLGNSVLHGVHSFSFYGDKMVIVSNSKKEWTPPGGGIEPGENYAEASIREVKEEANMKVLSQEYIGYQDIFITDENRWIRQARMFCIVEPYGDFESDPDGDIFEIKLIDPKDYKQYFDWGEIGGHLMERALKIKSTLE